MKIHFIGLSSFLIENDKGFRVLVDPFNDAPEWSLGLTFPKTFAGKPMGANIVLMSEPDADHAAAPGDWLTHAPATKPNSDPFPGLDLRGTVVYEWNGDVNIAWHYTIDGVRILHLADNAHTLTKEQLPEIGHPDVVFISPPKSDSADDAARQSVRDTIAALQPRMIFWAHHLVPTGVPIDAGVIELRHFFVNFFKQRAATNAHYEGEKSFIELCHILENALVLNGEFRGVIEQTSTITVDKESLPSRSKPVSLLFTTMLSN